MSQYQTVKYPDKLVEGAFPTLEWFGKFGLDFKGKNVVDIGCAEGMYALRAKQSGANRVVCVDSEQDKADYCKDLFDKWGYQSEVYTAKFEDMAFDMDYDITFLNMILHWLENPQDEFRRVADATKENIVVIYRTYNDKYEKGWFPTEEELERLAKSVGFEVKHKELLMTQAEGKQIVLTIFERYKSVKPEISLVRKDSKCFDKQWFDKLESIKPYLHNPILHAFSVGHCWTQYIDGRDLYGDRPFHPLHGKQRQVFLNDKEKKSIRKLLNSIHEAGKKTGFYMQDVTKRNIILKDEEAYLIDYDEIGKKADFHV